MTLRLRFQTSFCLFAPLLLAGCVVNSHKSGKDGKDKDVNIGTPFGSMHVKTNEDVSLSGLGLTPYPGAQVVDKEGNNNGAADVNMSFGGFHLGVHAVELKTPDPQGKVLAFYRKDMARYGTVLTCRGQHAVGEPTRTVAGLSCDSEKSGADNNELELRAGSELHQHIVSLNTKDGQTHIGLVALDLPAGLEKHTPGDRE